MCHDTRRSAFCFDISHLRAFFLVLIRDPITLALVANVWLGSWTALGGVRDNMFLHSTFVICTIVHENGLYYYNSCLGVVDHILFHHLQ